MNEQPKKRTNPFDRVINIEPKEEKEEVVEEVQYNNVQQQPVVQPNYNNVNSNYNYNIETQPNTTRTPRKTTKPQYIQPVEVPKEKYTATMDVSLRRKIKIYCATHGRMFSEFIEEACREKLLREGIK